MVCNANITTVVLLLEEKKRETCDRRRPREGNLREVENGDSVAAASILRGTCILFH